MTSIYTIKEGWLDNVRQCPSENYNSRPTPEISLLVIHNISLPENVFGTGDVEALFMNRLSFTKHPSYASLEGLKVSAHCLIDREGMVTQFVSFKNRAWHAGLSEYQGRNNCNDFSIGIELEGSDHQAFTDSQYTALTAVTKCLFQQYPLLHLGAIVGHNEIAPQRKTDPGPYFEWARYRHLISQ